MINGSPTNPDTGHTTYAYDEFGNLELEETSGGGGSSFVHDSLGRELIQTDLASEATVEHAYTADAPPSAEIPVETQDDGSGTTTLVYQSPSGRESRRVTSFEDGLTLERSVTARDAAGREAAVTETAGGATRVTQQAYDDLGRLTRVWGTGYEASAETTDAYTYQPGSSLVASEELQLTGGAAARSYAYDKAGRVVEAVRGDTMTATTYDAKGRVASTTTTTGGSGLQGVSATIMSPTARDFNPITATKLLHYGSEGLEWIEETFSDGAVAITQLLRDALRRTIGKHFGPVQRDIEREKVDPHYGQLYTYYPWGGYPGAGKLYIHEDPETDYTNTVAYNASSQVAGIGSWEWVVNPWLYLDNRGNQSITWDGLRTRTIATDLPNGSLEATFTYAFNADGRPVLARVQGNGGGQDIDLFIWLVTDSEGSVIRLLDSHGGRFAEYDYDADGKASVWSCGTGLLNTYLAAAIADNQMLRYRGYPYSDPLGLYWKGDWFDPETGEDVWPEAQPPVYTSLAEWADSFIWAVQAWKHPKLSAVSFGAGAAAAFFILGPIAGDEPLLYRIPRWLDALTKTRVVERNPWAGDTVVCVTRRAVTMYRVWGGAGSKQQGPWLSLKMPMSSSAARANLALPSANSATYLSRVVVPAGTRIQVGVAGSNWGQPGGWEQVRLLQEIPASCFGEGVLLPL